MPGPVGNTRRPAHHRTQAYYSSIRRCRPFNDLNEKLRSRGREGITQDRIDAALANGSITPDPSDRSKYTVTDDGIIVIFKVAQPCMLIAITAFTRSQR